MSSVVEVKKIAERNWDIIPPSLEETIELGLACCTGIVAFEVGSENSPFLIVHSGPTVGSGIPAVVMHESMNSPEYNGSQSNSQRISLAEILRLYKAQLSQSLPEIGVYLASGERFNPTDLGILRSFIMDPNYTVFGAELKEMTRMRLLPSRRLIEFMHPVEERHIRPAYEIGKRYKVNMGS